MRVGGGGGGSSEIRDQSGIEKPIRQRAKSFRQRLAQLTEVYEGGYVTVVETVPLQKILMEKRYPTWSGGVVLAAATTELLGPECLGWSYPTTGQLL